MSINPKVRDRDPKVTLRRVLLVVNAVGGLDPVRVVDWIAQCVEGSDGDILKVKAFALAARSGRENVLPHEAVAVIRDVCVRRLSA